MDYYSVNYIGKMILEECLNELNKQDREIILLYYWWGYRDLEIGKILDESQQMINYRRKRALKRLEMLLPMKCLSHDNLHNFKAMYIYN